MGPPRTEVAMRLLRAVNINTYRYLVRDAADGVIREVVLALSGPGSPTGTFEVAHRTDVAPMARGSHQFHMIELRPGLVHLVIPELQDGFLKITELDGSYDPASSEPVAWGPPSSSIVPFSRPDGRPLSDGAPPPPYNQPQLRWVTGTVDPSALGMRLFFNIENPNVAGPSGISYETWTTSPAHRPGQRCRGRLRCWAPLRSGSRPACPRERAPRRPDRNLPSCTVPSRRLGPRSPFPSSGNWGPTGLPLTASWWTRLLPRQDSPLRPRRGPTGSGSPSRT